MRKILLFSAIIFPIAAVAQQLPVGAPPDPLQMQISTVQRRIDQGTADLKAMAAGEAAIKGLKAADEATLATLRAQLPKPKEQKK